MLSTAIFFVLLFITLQGILAQQQAESPVYCVKNAPAIFWPSDSLPNVERVSFQDAKVQLTIAPAHDDGSVVVRLQSIPYQSAVLRINLPGTFSGNNNSPSASNSLDCGSRAAGITSTDTDSLLTIFSSSSSESVYDALPLQLDITIIVSRTEDGPNSSLVYAYERIYLEEWMWDTSSSKQMGETDGVGVVVLRNSHPSVTLNFGATTPHNESTTVPPSSSSSSLSSPLPRTPPSKTLVVPAPTANPTSPPGDAGIVLNPLKSTYGTEEEQHAQSSLPRPMDPSSPTNVLSSSSSSNASSASNPTNSPTIDTSTSFPTTSSPTIDISTSYPTSSPTRGPTSSPTRAPTRFPTSSPTISPTSYPTISPTSSPTISPTSSPTRYPTSIPTLQPSTYSPTPPSIPKPQWIDSVDITTAGSSEPAVVLVPNIMVEGTHVHLAEATPLSLVAHASSPQVHKVSFLYNGVQRVEGTAPYVMGGNSGDLYTAVEYLSSSLPTTRPGVKVVTVRAHDASMNVLESVTYTFTVDIEE